MDRDESLSAASALATSAIGIAAGPGGILIGAGVNAAAQQAIARVADERRRRGERVLISAGTRAELAVDQLIDRLTASPDGERLLVRAVLAAGSARTDERLLALSNILARGARSEDAAELATIQAFAEVIGELTDLQAEVLGAFTMRATELGLGGGRRGLDPIQQAFDPRMTTLNAVQLAKTLPHFGDALVPTLAALQRLGLIEVGFPGGSSLSGGGTPVPQYTITAFGERVVHELRLASEATEPHEE
jgi:hypothetical protein